MTSKLSKNKQNKTLIRKIFVNEISRKNVFSAFIFWNFATFWDSKMFVIHFITPARMSKIGHPIFSIYNCTITGTIRRVDTINFIRRYNKWHQVCYIQQARVVWIYSLTCTAKHSSDRHTHNIVITNYVLKWYLSYN